MEKPDDERRRAVWLDVEVRVLADARLPPDQHGDLLGLVLAPVPD